MSEFEMMSFGSFMKDVDAILERKTGFQSDDLSDATWVDYHEDGLTPAEAVAVAIEDGLLG